MRNTLTFMLLLGGSCIALGQLAVIPTDKYVDAGSTIQFQISGGASNPATYEIKHIGPAGTLPALASGNLEPQNGIQLISYQPSQPGFYGCYVTQNGNTVFGTAAYKPHEIGLFGTVPADWLSFWTNQKALLGNVAPNVVVQLHNTTEYTTEYKISANTLGNQKIYGYLTIPNGVGPFPAIVQFPAFGHLPNVVVPNSPFSNRLGVIVLNLNVHPNAPDQIGSESYATDGIENRETFYYRHVMLGMVRLIDYLESRSDFNGKVGTFGDSQGGGLAMLAAGIDNRISVVLQSVGSHSAQSAHLDNQSAGFPFYYKLANLFSLDIPAVLNACQYYDASYAMSFFEGSAYHFLGYKDEEVCPPGSIFSAIAAAGGKQVVLHGPNFQHFNPEEFTNYNATNGVPALLRRIWPETQTPPWPYPQTTLGYWWDAGQDTLLNAPSTLTLHTSFLNEAAAASGNFLWTQLSGPAGTVIDDATLQNPSISFALPGNYEFLAVAEVANYGSDKFLTLQDKIKIFVADDTTTTATTAPFSLRAKLQPNPANTHSVLHWANVQSAPDKVLLSNAAGQILQTWTAPFAQSSLQIETATLPAGLYFVRLAHHNVAPLVLPLKVLPF